MTLAMIRIVKQKASSASVDTKMRALEEWGKISPRPTEVKVVMLNAYSPSHSAIATFESAVP
jgi:hypothetical protein